ncbi:MAG: NUDIX domain-containing protein [Candidatus Binatia bacterium]
MLQQTQVATATPYYERFLRKLPTLHALHRAPLRRVLALWSGLGYYRRAENLKKSAGEIIRKYGGRIPDNYEILRSLPGIGDYTAGALMSIAFQQPYPAIDGNARRVLDRLFDPKDARELLQLAPLLISRTRPGYFNQGLMELGATICVPKDPRCPRCPVAAHCAARRTGRRTNNMRTVRTAPTRDIEWPLAIFRRDGKLLLRERAGNGLLAGLWEFPGGEEMPNKHLRDSLVRQLAEPGQKFPRKQRIGEFRHSITHRRIRSPVFLFELPKQMKLRLPSRRWRWLAPALLADYPVSSMTFKAAKLLVNHEKRAS